MTTFAISGASYLAVAAHGSDDLIRTYMASDGLPWSLCAEGESTAPLRYALNTKP